MLTSIIVPVYGDSKYLVACLVALVAAGTDEPELILVDNGTGDVHEAAGDIVIINPTNLGFAKACNQGAEAATGDILVFLNVDTEVQDGWLEPLIAPLESRAIGAAGARLLYPSGDVQHAGVEFFRHHGELAARNIKTEMPSRNVNAVTGACLAVRPDVFAEVGMFDEGYWNGYDDVDLCCSIRAVGYRIRYVAESTVIHHESVTGEERWKSVNQNVARLQTKWADHPLFQ